MAGGVIYKYVIRDRDSDVMFHWWHVDKDQGMCSDGLRWEGVTANDNQWRNSGTFLIFKYLVYNMCIMYNILLHWVNDIYCTVYL